MPESRSSANHGVVSLNIKEHAALYAAYMRFVKGGGIFFPTTRKYHPGDEVFMLIALPDGPERFPVAGRVVWITPENAQSNQRQGVGIQFNENESGAAIRKKIEALLGGTLAAAMTTHTM